MMASREVTVGGQSNDKRAELIMRNINYINSFSYKTVQTMASERKLSANIRKYDMARLIALHDAGDEQELEQLMKEFRETRSKKRRLANASMQQGYVTTTAEADSASASADLDDDDDLFSPLNDDYADGDEDYDPHASSRKSNDHNSRAKPKKPRSSKGAASGKQARHSSYDAAVAPAVPAGAAGAAGLPGPGPSPSGSQGPGLALTHSPVVAPGTAGTSAVSAPSALPADQVAAGIRGVPEQELATPRKPAYRRSSGSSAAGGRGRQAGSRAGRLMKIQRDANFLYPKMAPALPSNYTQCSMARSPGLSQTAPADRGSFETPSQYYGSAFRPPAPYGHANPAAVNPMSRVGYHQPWIFSSEDKSLSSLHNPSRNAQASLLKQLAPQHTQQSAAKISPYPYSQPNLSVMPPQYTSKLSPDSSNQIYPSHHQMLNIDSAKPSVDCNNASPMNQELLNYQNYKSEKGTDYPYYRNANFQYANTIESVDSPYTMPSFAGNYDVSQTNFSGQVVSENHAYPQVIRPTPVPALPVNDIPSGYMKGNLELLFNVRSDHLQMPVQLTPYWKPANTNSVNSYAAPIIFASSSGPGLYQGSSHTVPYPPGVSAMPSYENSALGTFTNATSTYQHNPLYDNNFRLSYSQSQPPLLPVPTDVQSKSFSLDPVAPNHSLNQHEVPQQLYGLQSKFVGAQPYAQGSAVPQCLPEKSSLDQCLSKQSTQGISESHHRSRACPPQQKAHNTYQAQPKQHQPQQLLQEHSWSREREEQKFRQQKMLVQKKKQLFLHQQQVNSAQLAIHFMSVPDKKQTVHHSKNVSCELLQPPSLLKKEIGWDNVNPPHSLENTPRRRPFKTNSASQSSTTKHQGTLAHELSPIAKKMCYSLNRVEKQEPVNQSLSDKDSPSFYDQTSNLLSPNKSQLLLDAPQHDFSEFRGQNNQLSQQLIYDYLTSAEKQLTSLRSRQEANFSNSAEQDTGKQEPMETKASQSCYDFNNSIIDDVLPTLSKHLINHKLQESLKRSEGVNVSGENLNDLHCLGTSKTLDYMSEADVPVSIHQTVEPSSELYDLRSMEELPDKCNPQSTVGKSTDPGHSDLQSCKGTHMSPSKEKSDITLDEPNHPFVSEGNSCYVQLLPVPVENIQFEEMTKRSDDLIPLCAVQADSETCLSSPFKNDDVLTIPLTTEIDSTLQKVVKENESTNQAIFLCSNNTGEFEFMTLSVSQDGVFNTTDDGLSEILPMPSTTSLSKDMIKDINMNEVPPIESLSENKLSDTNEKEFSPSSIPCMDTKSGSEAVDVPLSQSDSGGMESDLNEDIPLTQSLSEDRNCDIDQSLPVKMGSEIDEEEIPLTQKLSEDIQNKSTEEEVSTETLQLSESVLNASLASTIPVTSREASSVTASSGISDYLSSAADVTDRQFSETPESQVPSLFGDSVGVESANSFGKVPSLLNTTEEVSEIDITSRKVPSYCYSMAVRSNRMDTEKDSDIAIMSKVKEETQELLQQNPENSAFVKVLQIYESNCEINNPITEKIEPGPEIRDIASTSGELNSEVCEGSGISNEGLLGFSYEPTDKLVEFPFSDVNMNIMKPKHVTCSVVLEQITVHEGLQSPTYLVTDPKEQQDSSLMRSRSAGKTYPGKQVRQPVRSSPRTSGRAGPSYISQPSSLPLSRSASPRLESAMQQPAKGRKSCSNFEHGCVQVLPPAQLSSHLLICEFTHLECPAMGCGWQGVAKKLSTHIREAHRSVIGGGTDSTHTVSVQEIHQQQLLTFLREVSRKLIVIRIHSFGNSIYASMQYVAPGRTEKPISACGTIEVVDKTGQSHAWRGKIGPIQQHLTAVRESGNCLQVTPESLGSIFDDTVITFHTNIRVSQSASS